MSLRFVHDLPVCDVEIDGQSLPLFFDLGGFDSIALETRQLERVQARYTGKTRSYSDVAGKRFVSRSYVIPRVAIGGIVLTDVAGSEHIHESEDPESTRMGYLGRGVLDQFRLIVDFPARKVLLLGGTGFPDGYDVARWPKSPLRIDRAGVSTEFLVDGTKRRLVLDTAAGRSRLRPAATGKQPADSTIHVDDLRMGDMSLGPHDFHAGPFRIPGVDGLLGSPFFMNHVVYIDFAGAEIAIRPRH